MPKCNWCNRDRKLTIHHIKNRLGEKEQIYKWNGKLIDVTTRICRPCHDEVELDYQLTGRVVLKTSFMRENTMKGIENNLYERMKFLDQKHEHELKFINKWIDKKMSKVIGRARYDHGYPLKIGLDKYCDLMTKLALAKNDIRYDLYNRKARKKQ